MSIKTPFHKITLVILLVFGISGYSNAQDYNTAIGLRGGTGFGLTIKHFIEDDVAIEGIVNSRYSGLNVTGLYEWHVMAFDIDGLNWYYGPGVHIGFWDGANLPWVDDAEAYTIIGVDFIGGLEYKIDNLPICISLDYKPAFNFVGYTGFWADSGALSVRYTF